MTNEAVAARDLLRHTLATISYRGGKTLRDTAADFPQFRAGAHRRPDGLGTVNRQGKRKMDKS